MVVMVLVSRSFPRKSARVFLRPKGVRSNDGRNFRSTARNLRVIPGEKYQQMDELTPSGLLLGTSAAMLLLLTFPCGVDYSSSKNGLSTTNDSMAVLSRDRSEGRVFSFFGSSTPVLCEEMDTTGVASKRMLEEDSPSDYEADDVPDFSRYGNNSLLKRYLSPELFRQLSVLKTSKGTRLEDIIRAAVSLPYGADPPRGVAGIYVGDAECYKVFAPLLIPIIEEYHNHSTTSSSTKTGLQRHRTNLNPQQLIQNRLDPSGEYILYTRMRLARSIDGFRFAACLARGERRKIENIIKACVGTWDRGKYLSVMEMSNEQHEDLIQRRILFQDPDEFALSANTHRDWPDGRGIYCDDWSADSSPGLMIWCNEEDHVWIISSSKGGNVQEVFRRLSEGARSLESSMDTLGYNFIEDKELGFLNSSPSNVGTGFRASVYMKLPLLGKQRGFYKLMTRLHLYAHSNYERQDKRYTGIFDIANVSVHKTF